MSSPAILLKNAMIVNEGAVFQGHLLLESGVIQKIFRTHEALPSSLEERAEVRDLSGLHLFPGVIDDQVHFREPGLTHKADIASESRAAVAGGITSFMEMPNTLPQTISQKALEDKFRMGQEKSHANYSFYIGATNKNIDDLKATDARNVCGIKVFMGSSTGNMLVDEPESLSRIFKLNRLPVAVHCEDELTIQANLLTATQRYGQQIPMAQHPVIRSHEACEKSSRLAISLAEKHGTRLHILHLSTANELRLLSNVPLSQKQITAEVCVHHLWFSSEDYAAKGSFIKWNPAIKEAADRDALIRGLADGFIDVVATDHAPHTLSEKQKPYNECPSGAPMVQHALQAMLEMYHRGIFSLDKVAAVMSHHPAICFQIKGRGFIREGYAADLVAVDLNMPYTVKKENLLYKCQWSPMEDVTFKSSVMLTFVNGHPVFEKGTFHEGIKSQALTFSR